MKLIDVPPPVLSEVMRNPDLVVSVAHLGEVDPEASVGTVGITTSPLGRVDQRLQSRSQLVGAAPRFVDEPHAEQVANESGPRRGTK